MTKKLVAYFSAGKETRFTARELADILKADLYEIKPLNPYTKEDLNWEDPDSRSAREGKDPSIRPALEEEKTDLSSYEQIFIGFPIWFDTFPRIIASFAENNDFENKTVIPFATSMGGGMGSVAEDLKALLPASAKVTEGLLLNGQIGKFKLETWLLTMGIKD
jgi:flavodoxin